MAMFDDWDWGKILGSAAGAIPGAVATVIGANKVADANTRAAQLAETNRVANQKLLADQNAKGVELLKTQTTAAQPAMEYLNSVVAQNPYQLNPQQTIELGDRSRKAVTSMPAGLSGSGRFRTAAVNDVQNRGRAEMIDTNVKRSDAAATGLAQRGAGATTAAANMTAGLGPQAVGVNNTGTDAQGNAITATADSNNVALNNIGSFFANAVKDADRSSRYQTFKTGTA